MPTTTVSWRCIPETSLALRLLVYAAVGSLAGPVVALVAAVAWVIVGTGDRELVILVAVVVLIGVGLSNRGVLLALRGEQPVGETGSNTLSRRTLAASVAVGATVAAVLGWVAPTAVVPMAASGFGWLLLGVALRTEGEITEETLRYGGREVPLAALGTVRRLRTGPRVWLWLSYEPGTVGATAPRFVSMPTIVFADAEASFERGTEREAETAGRRASTPVRIVAGVFALGCLAVGPVLWLLLPAGDGAAIALYGGCLGGLFGVVFLRYALVR